MKNVVADEINRRIEDRVKLAKEHKAEKCLELLKQWKKEKFNQ